MKFLKAILLCVMLCIFFTSTVSSLESTSSKSKRSIRSLNKVRRSTIHTSKAKHTNKLRATTKVKTKSQLKAELKAHTKTTGWVRPLIPTAKNYHSFANLAYCPGDIINQLGCPLCDSILDASFEVYKFHKEQVNGYDFTFVVLYSKNRHEVVVTFSGPKSPKPEFYSTIYASGFGKFQGVKVEQTYLDSYKGNFRRELHSVVKQYFEEHNDKKVETKVVFVGHSFGGSIATLAAFDLVKSGIVEACDQMDTPVVYSYGQLRIGDAEFVEEVNKLFRVVRVIKNSDYYPRMPNCRWSKTLGKFRCPRDHNNVITNYPEHWHYIMNYYGKEGGLSAGVEAPFEGNRMTQSFLERSVRSKTRAKGWHYSGNNPGYMMNGLSDPFDSNGKTSDRGLVTYSQPLGAEVLFSNKFNKYTICQYFYGIPNCERQLPKEFSINVNKEYFNTDLSKC